MRKFLPLCLIALAAPGMGQDVSTEPVGLCRFDPLSLTFAGAPIEQAECLMHRVLPLGELKPQRLPKVLDRVLAAPGQPSPAHKAAAIAAFPEPYRAFAIENADKPTSQTEAGLPLLYFVIHDTSTPFLGSEPFPKNLDSDPQINSFTPYMDGSIRTDPIAHIFLARTGHIWAQLDFSVPWRATKLESRVIGVPARGRFVHIEVIQPRRFIDGYDDLAYTQGPKPGFSAAQYRQLAALYIYASARAGHWLIPAQHATVDAEIPDGHDDPQNFELKKFAKALEVLLKAA